MTDVKHLLQQATPRPWHVCDGPLGANLIESGDHDVIADAAGSGSAALIVAVVNRAEDYEAALDALERLIEWWDAEYEPRESWAKSIDLRNEARAALARLRGGDTTP